MRWLTCLLFLAPLWAQTPSKAVDAVLDDWHQAAAKADEARYFGHFAASGVFMGTDATERWTVPEFRAWAKSAFNRKATWNFHPRDRHVSFSADGAVVWFDEMLDTANLGVCRGSGVLIREGGEWKIAQYNLSVPIPNSIVDKLVKEIGAAK
jgi:ketosteroid isomerase-like protein